MKVSLDATMPAPPPEAKTAEMSLGERAAIGRIEQALFGERDDRLVRVGRYEIRALLGSGAFGKVYRAHDPELHRDVALKVVEATAADRDELLGEARVMATISHPNVAPVHDAGIVDGRVFLVMELVAGGDLRAWLASGRDRPILEVLRQAGRGLAAAHAAGVVHRDFKPDNVLVGGDGRARVVDFGLSRASAVADTVRPPDNTDVMTTRTAALAGTPAYMAPELWDSRPASALSDQFAFCVTAWEALSGTRPFTGATLDELVRTLAGPLPPAPRAIGAAVGRVLARGMSRDPAARFPSLDALLDALEPRRPRWILPAALAATAILGTVAGVAATRSHADAPTVAPLAADPCPRPTEELAGVWDPARKAAASAAFAGSGPRGAEIYARVEPVLDRAAAGWLDARREACVATEVRHAQSPQTLDRRVACLRDWRRQFAALTGAFAHPTGDVVSRASTSASELPSLAHCADADAMAAGPPVPTDPELAAQLDELAQKLADARAAWAAGSSSEAVELAQAVVADPATARYPPLAIEATLTLGETLGASGRFDEARAASRQAFDLATSASDKRSALIAATDVAMLGAYDPSRIADAQQWLHTAQALLAQLDGDRELEARLAHVEGTVDLVAGVPSAAQPAIALAIADFQKLDPDHPLLGASLSMLGSAELDLGKVEDAERHLREALARDKRDLGDDHPEVASAEINLALVLAARGFYADAIAQLDAGLALQIRVLGSDYGSLAYGYLARAEADKARGDLASAGRDLALALPRARAGYGPTNPITGQTELATAELEAALGHGAAAVASAKAARDLYATTDTISIALADATLARALAADHHDTAALELARDAAARIAAQPLAPGAIRGIVNAAYGELALAHGDPAAAAGALRDAEGAFLQGAPTSWRLARVRFALARALVSEPATALAEAELAAKEFPRDGDPALKAAIADWIAKHSK